MDLVPAPALAGPLPERGEIQVALAPRGRAGERLLQSQVRGSNFGFARRVTGTPALTYRLDGDIRSVSYQSNETAGRGHAVRLVSCVVCFSKQRQRATVKCVSSEGILFVQSY